MSKKVIPFGKALGPYSPGLEVGGGTMLFVSGQIPMDPASGEMICGDFSAQARQVLKNVKGVLAAAGYRMSDLVKITVYLTDLADFAALNELFKEFFTERYPARATVQVAALPKEASVEIEGIAIKQ